MKILIIPDVHGNWKDAIQNIKDHKDEVDKVVVLGDYVDDWDENLNGSNMVEGFNSLMEFKNNEPDKFEVLFGNHDLSYLAQTRNGECVSGHHYEYADKYKKMFEDNIDNMNIVYKVGNILFSHAGISMSWLQNNTYYFNERHRFDKVPEEISKKYADLNDRIHDINKYYFDGMIFSLVNVKTPEEQRLVDEYRKIEDDLHDKINNTYLEMREYEFDTFKTASIKNINKILHTPRHGDKYDAETFEHCGWEGSGNSHGESCVWIRPEALLEDTWPNGIKYQIVGHTELGERYFQYKHKRLIVVDSPSHGTYKIIDTDKMDDLVFEEFKPYRETLSKEDLRIMMMLGLLR